MTCRTKVLVVDDTPGQVSKLIEALRDHGCEVKLVQTTDAALKEIDSSYDAYVFDLLMPVGSELSIEDANNGTATGLALARRAFRKHSVAPITIMSAIIDHDAMEWCNANPSRAAFVTKGVPPREIVRVLDEKLQKAREATLARVLSVLDRFALAARRLTNRRKGSEPFVIENEYDVQDLLHALLMTHFDGVQAEQATPAVAGGSSRIDFLLPAERLGIEVKMPRNPSHARDLVDELLIDIARYQSHDKCHLLQFFVYDPKSMILDPGLIKLDLEARSTRSFRISVLVSK